MQPTSPSRREFLKQGSGVLIGALVFSSGPIALLAPSKVWALELSALDEPTGRALLKFARHLYPHDTMEDAVYAMVVKALDKGAADPGEKKLLVDGVAALDRAAGGDWMAKSPDRQLVAVRPRSKSASTSSHGPWQIAPIGFPCTAKSLISWITLTFMRR